MSAQSFILADSILFFCAHVGNLAACTPLIDAISAKHVSRMVQPAHYDAVSVAFESAVRQILADSISEQDYSAWMKAVNFIAHVLITAEKDRYLAIKRQYGAWMGFRQFSAVQLHADDKHVFFALTPSDDGPLVQYLPGQNICIRIRSQQYDHLYIDAKLPGHSLHTTDTSTSLKLETRFGVVYPNVAPGLCMNQLYVVELPKVRSCPSSSGESGKLRTSKIVVDHLRACKPVDISVPFGNGYKSHISRVTSWWDMSRRNLSKRLTWDAFADEIDISISGENE